MEILGIIGIMGMIATIGNAGQDNMTQSDALDNTIQQVQDKNAQWKDRFTDMINVEKAQQSAALQAIIKDLDQYGQYSAQIKIQKEKMKQNMQRIQITGIVVVLSVFFLLLLKTLGLFAPIWKFLTTPERYLFHLVFHKKTK